MRITDTEQSVINILAVRKGKIPPSFVQCDCRHSDCLVYVLSGDAEYLFDGKSYKAEAGNVLYLARNSRYCITVTSDNYTFIYTDFYFENSDNNALENDVYRGKGIELLESSFEKLHRLWVHGNFADKIACKALIYGIYSEIITAAFSQYVPQKRQEQIGKIANYMIENLSDANLTVETLSKMCGVSAVHLRRIFGSIYHVSPIRFLTTARINRAKELLINESCSIAEISELCGFTSCYYFSKVFKQETGITPTEFRKLYK